MTDTEQDDLQHYMEATSSCRAEVERLQALVAMLRELVKKILYSGVDWRDWEEAEIKAALAATDAEVQAWLAEDKNNG